jgi:hypothetical protein
MAAGKMHLPYVALTRMTSKQKKILLWSSVHFWYLTVLRQWYNDHYTPSKKYKVIFVCRIF